jgi:hypothetical protein
MLSVTFNYYHAECHHSEGRYAECHHSVCRYAECRCAFQTEQEGHKKKYMAAKAASLFCGLHEASFWTLKLNKISVLQKPLW